MKSSETALLMKSRSFYTFCLLMLALVAVAASAPKAFAQGYADSGNYFSLTEGGGSGGDFDYVYERGPTQTGSPLVKFLSSKYLVFAILIFAVVSYSQGNLEASTISFGIGIFLVLLKKPVLLVVAMVFFGSFYFYNRMMKGMAKKEKDGKGKGKKKGPDSQAVEELSQQVADLECEVETLRASPPEKKGAGKLLTNSSTGQHER